MLENITWLAKKNPNWLQIKQIMSVCEERNHYTNNGPVCPLLEDFIRKKLEIDDSKAIIVTNNGASAIHAAVIGLELFHKSDLKFITQSFTFPSNNQGPLKNSIIVDIDETGGLDLNKIPHDTVFDGLIVTNVLGNVTDIQTYVTYAEDR